MANQSVEFDQETCMKIERAIHDILYGFCNRVEVSKNVKVYECKNVIRIDLKIVNEVTS